MPLDVPYRFCHVNFSYVSSSVTAKLKLSKPWPRKKEEAFLLLIDIGLYPRITLLITSPLSNQNLSILAAITKRFNYSILLLTSSFIACMTYVTQALPSIRAPRITSLLSCQYSSILLAITKQSNGSAPLLIPSSSSSV